MDRRQFLKATTLGALTLGAPFLHRDGEAAAAAYGGPFFILVHAGGAWDPRFHFDPIASGDQNRYYTQITTIGNVAFADWPVDLTKFNLDTTLGYDAYLLSNSAFLTAHGSRFTIINGIDTSTNNHEAGTRATWSGRLLGEYPAFGALVAAAKAKDQPMAFLSSGGYDFTAGLVPLTRVGSPSTLPKIAFPNVIDPSSATPAYFHTDETAARIQAALAARTDALRKRSTLPVEQASLDALVAARGSAGELARFTPPATLATIPGYQLGDLQRLMQSTQIAIAAFKSGVAAVATVTLGGFDTHGNHDRDHPRQLAKLWKGLDFLFAEATTAGIAGNLYVIVGSDFGRGPTYNSTNTSAGKDHWPVTTLMVAGPGIPGNRVIGATDPGLNARPLDPTTLQPSDGGTVVTPEIIHGALRRVAGIEDFAANYPLAGASMPLFG